MDMKNWCCYSTCGPCAKGDVSQGCKPARSKSRCCTKSSRQGAGDLPTGCCPPATGRPACLCKGPKTYEVYYVCKPVRQKEIFPWAVKAKFQPPCVSMEGNTIYNRSYVKPHKEGKRQAIRLKENDNILNKGPCPVFNTIYNHSYILNCGGDKRGLILPQNQLCNSCEPLESHTIQKMSYPGHCKPSRPSPIYPHNHNLIGTGPMQTQTTQNHDYTPKEVMKRRLIKQENNLQPSDKAMPDVTTMRMSYLRPRISRVQNFKPKHCPRPPECPMDGCTIYKLSYLNQPNKVVYECRLPITTQDRTKFCHQSMPDGGNVIKPCGQPVTFNARCPMPRCCRAPSSERSEARTQVVNIPMVCT